ncbi:MAG: 3'-5' exonuclease [Pseudomonadales bacterium]
MKQRTIVLDFETTGLSARGGDRVIEVGAVAVVDGKIVEQYQSLMNPGYRVSSFIEDYTGISNEMLSDAPNCREVIPRLQAFLEDSVVVAHNASFDRGFLDAEYEGLGFEREQPFLCSMRIARRLYPNAPNHKLGTLVRYTEVKQTGQFHRALADAEMTAGLWLKMMQRLRSQYALNNINLKLLQKLEGLKISSTEKWLHEAASQ